MLSYEFLLREERSIYDDWSFDGWDVFLSAYNLSERVGKVFEKSEASQKCWFISPEYSFTSHELPSGYPIHQGAGEDEAGSIVSWLSQVCPDVKNKRICVDSTGFMRHHLLILMKHLRSLGVRQFDVLYSEPDQYTEKEKTTFSVGDVIEVRQVSGFEGTHNPDTSNDLLIIGAGYDHSLIAHAAEFKSNARKLQVLGFPSLRPDMYQENVLQAQKAAEQVGGRGDGIDTVFVPANDPFNTALRLHQIVEKFSKTRPISNLYLCPISTKAMTVGFGLYYLAECDGKSASMILPYTKKYSKGTSEGVGRVWLYGVEL